MKSKFLLSIGLVVLVILVFGCSNTTSSETIDEDSSKKYYSVLSSMKRSVVCIESSQYPNQCACCNICNDACCTGTAASLFTTNCATAKEFYTILKK